MGKQEEHYIVFNALFGVKVGEVPIEFAYYDLEGRRCTLTLTRGAPAWVNLDCPTIYVGTRGNEYQLLHRLTIMALGTTKNETREIVEMLTDFVCKSERAYDRQYGPDRSGQLLMNFRQANPWAFD